MIKGEKKETGTAEKDEKSGRDGKSGKGGADGKAESAAVDFTNPVYYTNRELSWLDFNYRILDEARDRENPLFERLKFLSITASNLDEFFMVRVASLRKMADAGYSGRDIAGMTAGQQLDAVQQKCHEFIDRQYSTLSRSLVPALKARGLEVLFDHESLTDEQAAFCDRYFDEMVFPVLTPMAMDASRPFPLVRNKTLNIGTLISRRPDEAPEGSIKKIVQDNLARAGERVARKAAKDSGKEGRDPERKDETMFATVQVPSVLPRLVELPPREDGTRVGILLEDIIERNMGKLFPGFHVVCANTYRITRNADMTLDEDDADDLLEEIQKKLKRRQWGKVIRFEYEDGMDKKLFKILKKEFGVSGDEIYKVSGPLDLTFLMKLYGMKGFENLRQKPYVPQPVPALMNLPEEMDLFGAIRRKDIFLSHPYETFEPVISLIRTAAEDPDVLAIKMTLYRVSGHSPIVAALARAAENGKQVTVLVELKARFDEENNIQWAEMLEKAGCHVIYGLIGLKTHSKIALVVRREEDGIVRYVHLATGNYNDSTAKQYTDCGIMTAKPAFGEDATAVFNMLSGYSEPKHWNKLALAPIWLRQKFYALIDREIAHAKAHEGAHIIAKMNSLCDPGIIEKLYEASAAGVRIELIVRGICCLRVGIPGVSENITVRSIVGTYLEHARIFWFANGEHPEIYMSSADWMPRNLNRRVEILFPLEDEDSAKAAKHILDVQLADTLKAHILQPDNTYEKVDRRGKAAVGAQAELMREAVEAAENPVDPFVSRTFTPASAGE